LSIRTAEKKLKTLLSLRIALTNKNISEECLVYRFPNGIRLVYQQHPSRITHCGFVLDVGSRDEEARQMGMAHFIEHLFFKGTGKRKSIHILNRLEFVGGELNAYTSKDKTCVYASVPAEYFSRSLELLTDIVFHSSFPEKEVEKEKKVIHEEIDMYLDSPEENILDLFQERAFRNHALGFNILGTHETLASFHRSHVMDFYKAWYSPERIAFVYNGNKSFRQVIRLCERYFGELPSGKSAVSRMPANGDIYKHFDQEISTSHVQTYLAMGGMAFPSGDPRRVHASLLMNMLGGPGLNSKLNLAIREKYGYAYDIEASYQAMRDIGTYQIYMGTDRKYLSRTQELIYRELKALCAGPVSSLALHRYKSQFKGQILMSEENRISLALMSGKMALDGRPIEPLASLFAQIDKISAENLVECARELFREENISRLVFLGQ
jgi:predicted Zn-dependent peptidase